jgi:hypothetical protein
MKNILLICVVLTGMVLAGCENNEILLSEKKLNSELNGTWKIVAPRPSVDFTETWVFSGGSTAVSSSKNSTSMNVSGRYSVDAKFSKAYIDLSGYNYNSMLYSGFSAADLNRKWTLVELSEKVLYISATDDRGAIRSIEFVKQ